MTDRPYSKSRVSHDDRWHVVAETPNNIATPRGGISINWRGSPEDEQAAIRVAGQIVNRANSRPLKIMKTGDRDFIAIETNDGDRVGTALRLTNGRWGAYSLSGANRMTDEQFDRPVDVRNWHYRRRANPTN